MTKTTVADATPQTWRAKPEYDAMKALHTLLHGTEPVLSPLAYTLDGDVKHTLAQSDRAHLLFVWRDVDVFVPSRKQAGEWIDVPPVDATLTLTAGRTVNGTPVPAGTPTTIPVAGELVVVQITKEN